MATAQPDGQAGLPSNLLESRSAVLGLYAALTAVMTFPLIASWRTSLPAGSGDLWQNYWNFWWWKQCLLEGLNPLRTEVLFHPSGVDLVFHTHSPFNQILAMPVNLLFGEAAAYNSCVLLALTLSGFGTYLLVRELTGSAPAGFFAGLVFAYFPQTLEQTLEHLNLFSTQFIPLSLFYLARWSKSLRRMDAVAFGACFGLNALCSWHLGVKLALVVAPWVVWIAWRNRDRWTTLGRHIGMAAALATLLVLPFLVPMVSLMAEGSEYFNKGPVNRGIDASYLFTAPYANPVFGGLVLSRYLDRAYQASGFVCYLGLVPFALAAVAAWQRVRGTAGWIALFVLGVVLALGAHLLWDGSRYQSVALPFAALESLPVLGNLRVANRFLLLAGLGLSVLAGYGWKSLRLKSKLALPVAALVLLAEYSWLPFPMQEVEFSPLLKQVAERPGAVLDVPFHQRSRTVHNMASQTVHAKPISGGYLTSYPPEVEANMREHPALGQLAGVPESTAVVDAEALRRLGFRTVVVHKRRANSVRDRMLASLEDHELLKRKRVLRLGGVPDDAMASIRRQLDSLAGGACLEDNQLAVYCLE
ncbi:MAG: hypothetical protein OXH99_19065 [Bryobacterales bacterium]|nr:hypothetical protein [Bryobacterales bacterium]